MTATAGPPLVDADAGRCGDDGFQDVLDGFSEGVAVFAADRLIRWNRRFAECLRLPPDRLIQELSLEDLAGLDRPDGPLRDIAVLATEARSTDTSVVRERRLIDRASVVLTCRPRPGGVAVFVADARGPDEATTQHARRVTAIGRVIDGIAHDFNNVLAVVMMTLDGLYQDKAIADKHTRRIAVGLSAAQRGARLVRHLLAFTRNLPPEREVAYLPELMPPLLDLAQRALGESVQLDYRCGNRIWTILLDAAQFDVAFVNAVLLARDRMPGRGTLAIALENAPAMALDDPRGSGDFLRLVLSFPRASERRGSEVGGSGAEQEVIVDFMRQSGGLLRVDADAAEMRVAFYFPRYRDMLSADASPEMETPARHETALGE